MWKKDETLHELQRKAARKAYLHSVISALRNQARELAEKVERLDKERKIEQGEFDKMSGKSLSAFFYTMAGKKDEQLVKEQREALAAQAKYDTAVRELEAVKQDIKRYSKEYLSLVGFDIRYEKLLKEKAQALKANGNPEAERIVELEKQLAEAESAKEEITEAVSAAKRADRSVSAVLENLSHAEEWASWDIIGGGMIADRAKQDKLDAAQNSVEVLQVDLRLLKAELADIAENAEIRVDIEGFLRFADWFFDGIFADYSILQRIDEAKEKIYDIKNKIKQIISHLQEKLAETDARADAAKSELDTIVLKAEV